MLAKSKVSSASYVTRSASSLDQLVSCFSSRPSQVSLSSVVGYGSSGLVLGFTRTVAKSRRRTRDTPLARTTSVRVVPCPTLPLFGTPPPRNRRLRGKPCSRAGRRSCAPRASPPIARPLYPWSYATFPPRSGNSKLCSSRWRRSSGGTRSKRRGRRARTTGGGACRRSDQGTPTSHGDSRARFSVRRRGQKAKNLSERPVVFAAFSAMAKSLFFSFDIQSASLTSTPPLLPSRRFRSFLEDRRTARDLDRRQP